MRTHDSTLRPADLAMFERLGVGAELLFRHGIRRVTDPEARDQLSSHHPGGLAGILIPYLDPETGHQVSARVRRDNPEIEDGKPSRKYMASYGDHPHLFFCANAGDQLADVTISVVLVEAEKSSLAFMAAATRLDREILPIALGGCNSWHTSRAGKAQGANGARVNVAGPQPDLDRVTWTGRDAVIVFDSNAADNASVRSARRRFAANIQSRGAKVRIGIVPVEPGVNGPDDYRAAHDDHHLLRLVDDAVPVQPATVEDVLVDCGFSALTEPVDLSALEPALRELADLLRSADPIRRQTTRAAVIARLKSLGVDGRAGLVDAAIGMTEGAADQVLTLVRDDEPWPDPVNGAAALDVVVGILKRYLVLPAHAADAIGLWIVHAYAMAAWSVSPLLALVSPVKRCGKTTTLLVVGALTPKSLQVSNVTAAVLFRLVEDCAPTLLSDEADTWLCDETSELRGIFNAGHTRGAAVVARCVGDDHEVKLFSVWAPKAIAMIGRPPGTIEDRSILIELRRKSAGEQVARLRLDRISAETTPIRQQLKRWTQDHMDALRAADPDVPSALHDRDQDNWRPLLAIADQAGGHWPARARTAALALCGNEAAEDIGAELLADIRTVFETAGDPAEMASAEMLKNLVEMEDRPWSHWSKGEKPITGSKLARMLKPFKVSAAGSIRVGAKTARAYRRDAFMDAWTRYLPVNTAFKACQRDKPNESGPEPAISMRDTGEECHVSESEENSMNTRDCHAVTLPNPDSGAEEGKGDDDGTF